MSNDFELNAEKRDMQGKGASRRLRHAGKLPAIVYGGGKEPEAIMLKHNEVMHSLENEAFYSHILTLNLDSTPEQVILRDIQRHPIKPIVMHIDFLRIKAGEKLRMNVPLHFVGDDVSPGVKAGGVMSHIMTDFEIECLPKDLPEFIEVNVSELDIGDSVHMFGVPLPEGVVLVSLIGQDDLSEEELQTMDHPVASVMRKMVKEEEPEVEAAEDGAEGEEGTDAAEGAGDDAGDKDAKSDEGGD